MSARETCTVTSELLPSLIQESSDGNLVSRDRTWFATHPRKYPLFPIAFKFADVTSKFPFHSSLREDPKVDDDGDLILDRRDEAIFIEHGKSTTLDKVGLQVWRGALLLADWVLHNHELLKGATVLELGSGTGLTSIAAATVAKEVVSTGEAVWYIFFSSFLKWFSRCKYREHLAFDLS